MEENTNLETTNEEVGAKTYTEEEVAQLIQKEADKRVSQALKTQKAKFEKEKSEAEKLNSMNEEQQLSYKLEQALNTIAEMNKAKAIADNTKQATQILAERNLPVQFVDYVVAEDAETMMEKINQFDSLWKAQLADTVNQRLAGSTPSKGQQQTGLTKEQFKKMTLQQQSELYKTNPTLYKTLSAR